jgi:hypothetical protein
MSPTKASPKRRSRPRKETAGGIKSADRPQKKGSDGSGDGRGKGDGKGKSPFGPVQVVGKSPTHYTPWLVVRYAAGDIGTRPLASGSVFWESPDVWVVSSLGINEPVPGEANQVFARVTNYGLQQANSVVVKFWWANPSVAITEATANLIGIGFVNIPSLRSVVLECPAPWIPIEENGGHECLLVEAYNPSLDPLTSPMDPWVDRHVGQKNEQLVVVQPGGSFHLRLSVANVSAFAQRAVLNVSPVLLDKVPPFIHARGLGELSLRPPTVAQIPLSLDVVADSRVFQPPSALFARRCLDASLEGGGARSAPQISQELHLEPWEGRVLELSGEVPNGTPQGQTFVFRIFQMLGPVVTGGYTVNVVVGR